MFSITQPPKRSKPEVDHLVTANIRLAFHFARRCRRLYLDADDALSAAMRALLRTAEQWDQDRAKFGTFAAFVIRRAIRNAAKSHHAKQAAANLTEEAWEIVPDAKTPTPLAVLADKDELETALPALRKALATLPERQRVVLLAHADGRSLESIGEQLGGLTRERVRQIEAAGLEKLKALLAKGGASA